VKRVLFAAAGALALVGAVVACRFKKNDNTAAPGPDASVPNDPATVSRGEYLVKAVAGCGECHTPRTPDGKLDQTKWLAGVPDRFDLEPDDDTRGGIGAPNLTPSASGLADWSDDEIRRAIVDGMDDVDAPLAPVMPYYVFHNMDPKDVDAIIAYLRTVPAVDNFVRGRQPLAAPLTAPADPVPDSAIPHTTLKKNDPNFARAEHGRYLAAQVGLCMDCHTPWRTYASSPLALDRLFAGGRGFSKKDWSVTQANAPPIVFSYNITPDDSGIAGWTPDMVVTLLKKGTDDQGAAICRPMPAGPDGAHGALTDSDAQDIGFYITTLAPIASGDIPLCPVEEPPPDQDAAADAASD
jgi:mono/diheme cytochrome c family protein